MPAHAVPCSPMLPLNLNTPTIHVAEPKLALVCFPGSLSQVHLACGCRRGPTSPSLVAGRVSAGAYFTLLIGADANVYSFGDDLYGQCGQGQDRNEWLNPERIPF